MLGVVPPARSYTPSRRQRRRPRVRGVAARARAARTLRRRRAPCCSLISQLRRAPPAARNDMRRIVGLGARGAHGMGIPIGKLALTARRAGSRSTRGSPVTLDAAHTTSAASPTSSRVRAIIRRARGTSTCVASSCRGLGAGPTRGGSEDFETRARRRRLALPRHAPLLQRVAAAACAAIPASGGAPGSTPSEQRFVCPRGNGRLAGLARDRARGVHDVVELGRVARAHGAPFLFTPGAAASTVGRRRACPTQTPGTR